MRQKSNLNCDLQINQSRRFRLMLLNWGQLLYWNIFLNIYYSVQLSNRCIMEKSIHKPHGEEQNVSVVSQVSDLMSKTILNHTLMISFSLVIFLIIVEWGGGGTCCISIFSANRPYSLKRNPLLHCRNCSFLLSNLQILLMLNGMLALQACQIAWGELDTWQQKTTSPTMQ